MRSGVLPVGKERFKHNFYGKVDVFWFIFVSYFTGEHVCVCGSGLFGLFEASPRWPPSGMTCLEGLWIDSLLEPQVAIRGTAATVTALQKDVHTRPVRTDQSERSDRVNRGAAVMERLSQIPSCRTC